MAISDGDPTTGEYEAPGLIRKSVNALEQTTTYNYNAQNLLTEVIHPENSKDIAAYDQSGNILSYTQKPKPGIDGSDLNIIYSYAQIYSQNECCDRPTAVTDPKGNTTEYSYDPVHGGVLTATGPAPSVGAPRPVKRYTYSQHYAWVKGSGGGYVQAASPIWLLDAEKTCQSSASIGNSCEAGSSDEIVTSYDYGPNSGPNNLWLRGKVVTAGGQSLRTCYSYDKFGNRISETEPAANLSACP